MPALDTDDRGNVFCCGGLIPIRLGVFLMAIIAILTSVLTLSARALGVDTSVMFGGYVLESQVMIGFLEVSGAIWGIIGLIGAAQCHSGSVTIFFYYQCIRCFVWVGVFFYDLPALWDCERWVNDIASIDAWNPKMYEVAMHGECVEKRLLFVTISGSFLALFSYFTYVNYTFIGMLNGELPFLIRDKTPHSAFVARSLANVEHERTPLIMEWPAANTEQKPLFSAAVAAPAPAGGGFTGYPFRMNAAPAEDYDAMPIP